jgi:hypothetical protein
LQFSTFGLSIQVSKARQTVRARTYGTPCDASFAAIKALPAITYKLRGRELSATSVKFHSQGYKVKIVERNADSGQVSSGNSVDTRGQGDEVAVTDL